MIDLHTHSFMSDGEYAPCELIRRAENAGYEIMALTDHVDLFNVDHVVSQIAQACDIMKDDSGIKVIAGAEVTHVPPQHIELVVNRARQAGAQLVVVHGETVVEPVKNGTNLAALKCDIDILAHPGLITEEEVRLAKERNIYLEITGRKGHSLTNSHVAMLCDKIGAKMVLNTDAHNGDDLFTERRWLDIALGAGIPEDRIDEIRNNSKLLAQSKLSR